MSLKFGTSGDKKFRELIMNTGEYTEDKEVLKARLVLSVDSTDWSRDDKELALKFGISWLFGFETKEIYGHLLDTDNCLKVIGLFDNNSFEQFVNPELLKEIRSELDGFHRAWPDYKPKA